jgi:LacI family transcriptional regulator
MLMLLNPLVQRPNPFAQAMRTNQSGTVGVAVSRITNPIVPEILEELASHLTRRGSRVVVWNTDTEGEQGLIDAIRSRIVDGIIFTAASHQTNAMEIALTTRLPVVSFNRYLEIADCDQIVSTNQTGGMEIADYLVRCGRKRIAFVNGPTDRTTLADRETGFRQGLKEFGLELGNDLYFRHEFHENAFRQIALDLAARPAPPDAIACGNDLIAIQMLNGLKAAGCKVPEDIWVTGFDGIEISGWDIVSLTTMRQPLELMAANAAEAVIDRIEGR